MKRRLVLILFAIFAFCIPVNATNTASLDLERDSSQYAYVTDTGVLDITGNMTIEAWIKLESLPSNGIEYTVVSKRNNTGNQRSYFFYLYNSSGTYSLRFSVWSDGSTGGEGVVTWTPSTATWYHVAVVYTAAGGTADFYVNGVQQGSQQSGLPTSVHNGTADFRVGAYHGDGYFDGLIDQVRIWNTTRTSTQINDNKTVEIDSATNLQGSWRLNNSYADASGNSNALTASGSPVFSADIPFGVGGLIVRKSADESVTSSTTLQDDNDLLISLAANTSYAFDGVIFVTSTSRNPDFKMTFTVPSGATMDIGYTAVTGTVLAQAEILETFGTESSTIPVDRNKVTIVHVIGTIKVSSTAGDVKLRWAQVTSDSTAITVKEGSYLRAGAI